MNLNDSGWTKSLSVEHHNYWSDSMSMSFVSVDCYLKIVDGVVGAVVVAVGLLLMNLNSKFVERLGIRPHCQKLL